MSLVILYIKFFFYFVGIKRKIISCYLYFFIVLLKEVDRYFIFFKGSDSFLFVVYFVVFVL